MKSKRLDAMAALTQLLVLIAIFLLVSYANAFLNLNQVAGNQIWLNHLIWFKETNKKTAKQILIRSLIWMVKQQIKDSNGMQSFSMSFQQNKSQNCFRVSQCSLMKRSFEDHQMLLMPVPNKLRLLSSMQVPTTNKVSHLPVFLSQLSVLIKVQDWLVWITLLR